MSDSLLIGLAMLRANWDRDEKTFVDNFVPFVADCLRDVGKQGSMTAGELQLWVQERFGIEIPHGALTTVLNRTVRRGLAERRDHKYWPQQEALEKVPLARRRGDVVREIECLLTKLVDYLQERHGEQWSRSEAEDALRMYVEEWSVPLLRDSLNGQVPRSDLGQRETEYLIGSFVTQLCREDPEGFHYFEALVKASMLTAGLYLDQGHIQQPFTKLTAYFDSPFLLSLLGVHGEEARDAAAELIRIATDLGVETACLPDTVIEVRGVLQATAQDLRGYREGRKVRLHPRVATEGLSPSQLEEFADQTEQCLRRHGLKLRARPTATRDGTTDLGQLDSLLQEHVGYSNDAAREHDQACLGAVHQIRKGQQQVRLERARAIFVTSNPRVVAAAAAHFGSTRDALAAPVAMMDHAFATLLWLKKPTEAPDLPWKQLIADCHAALNPDDPLWNRYLDEIDELADRDDIDEETYLLARHGQEARAALMERTRGRSDLLDDRSLREIVGDAKDAVRAPADARALEAERQMHELEYRKEAELQEAQRREEVRVFEASRAGQAGAAQALARRVARVLSRASYGAGVLTIGLAVLVAVPLALGHTVPWWLAWLPGGLGLAAAMSTLFGVSLPRLVDVTERRLFVRLLPWFERLSTGYEAPKEAQPYDESGEEWEDSAAA